MYISFKNTINKAKLVFFFLNLTLLKIQQIASNLQNQLHTAPFTLPTNWPCT